MTVQKILPHKNVFQKLLLDQITAFEEWAEKFDFYIPL